MLGAMGFHGREPRRRDREVAPRPAGRRFVEAREHEPLSLETSQGDEHRGLRDGPSHARLEREHERHAVRLAALAQHGEEHVELEMLE